MLLKLWFSCMKITTCLIGVGKVAAEAPAGCELGPGLRPEADTAAMVPTPKTMAANRARRCRISSSPARSARE